ncbi:MAG TPA: hypothetical protein PK159_09765 [Steroidobacteraceae bacterium]|nr:hypothetical protein [Steroidobacteraceae bacterium]
MQQILWFSLLAIGLAACGDGSRTLAGATPPAARPSDVTARQALDDRRGELVDPDASAMVFLYYQLAGIDPPIDEWIEQDLRVLSAPAIDKAARRTAVRAELEAAARAVQDVGVIHLTMNANLSDYDPSYGEFTIGALAPSSYVPFDAFRQKIALSFSNGRTAQIWSVPQDQAQAIRDQLGSGRDASLDVTVRITGVQPRPNGGAVLAAVMDYELRQRNTGQRIVRVQVADR